MTVSATSIGRVWAVVPVKRFSHAKERLALVLSQPERARLARAMLQDVLSALREVPQLTGIVVVSGDPAVTGLTRPFGVRVVRDELEAGINMAVRQSLDVLRAEPGAGVMIIPADVPFVTAAEVQDLLAALEDAPVVLAPAVSDGGTNALAMRSPELIAPCFGEDSFARHQKMAHAAGLVCSIVRSEGLGRDIDRPEDLLMRGRRGAPTWTRALLDELDVRARSRCGSPDRFVEHI